MSTRRRKTKTYGGGQSPNLTPGLAEQLVELKERQDMKSDRRWMVVYEQREAKTFNLQNIGTYYWDPNNARYDIKALEPVWGEAKTARVRFLTKNLQDRQRVFASPEVACLAGMFASCPTNRLTHPHVIRTYEILEKYGVALNYTGRNPTTSLQVQDKSSLTLLYLVPYSQQDANLVVPGFGYPRIPGIGATHNQLRMYDRMGLENSAP